MRKSTRRRKMRIVDPVRALLTSEEIEEEVTAFFKSKRKYAGSSERNPREKEVNFEHIRQEFQGHRGRELPDLATGHSLTRWFREAYHKGGLRGSKG